MSSVNATSCPFAPVGRGRSKKLGSICADSNFRTVSTFLTCGVTCGVTSGLGLVNAQPAAVNKILPKLRPAIPAQKPNQPRLWLACACQRWSRKPNHRRAAPDTIFRTTLTGAGEPYNGRGERAGILLVRMQNEHRVTNIIAAYGNKFVATPVNESIDSVTADTSKENKCRSRKAIRRCSKESVPTTPETTFWHPMLFVPQSDETVRQSVLS